MVVTNFSCFIVTFHAHSHKPSYKIMNKKSQIHNKDIREGTLYHLSCLSDPGIPGVRSMGRECLKQTEVFEVIQVIDYIQVIQVIQVI